MCVCVCVSICCVSIHMYIYIANSESVEFQSLGQGTADRMHDPKNSNRPGTLCDPFAVGLQSWTNTGVSINGGVPPNGWFIVANPFINR